VADDPNDNLGVGDGTPPLNPLGGASFEAEEQAMRSGKGRMLAAMIGFGVLAVAGIVAMLALGGEDEEYSKFGRNINGLRQEHFDVFWGCSLRGVNLADVRTNQDLMAQINRRATNGKARYGRQVRDNCLPQLTELEPKLRALITPEDMQEQVNELASSTEQLRASWSGFIAHLETLQDQPYDEDVAAEHVTNITKGWFDYRTTHNDLNKAVKAKLGR
jgi:hypothetical protein